MNTFVADPEWGWWIILYFYLGGLAAGAYFLATLVELFGADEDLPLSRIAFRLAFPLICVCGLLLIVDLERPERFWHMMFQSEAFPLPMLKWWSPMSIGAWAIGIFGACSLVSFLGTFWPESWLARTTGRGTPGRVFQVVGSVVGFFIASYTGVLLAATNQPTWSVSDWIGALFLTSAASTSIAAIMLLGRTSVSAATWERLERADLWALGLELLVFLVFLASLGGALGLTVQTPAGIVLVVGTLVAGLLVPLALHLGLTEKHAWRTPVAALASLAGGLMLRYGIVRTPAEVLAEFGDKDPRPWEVPLWETVAGKGLVVLALALAIALPLLLRRQWHLPNWQTTAMGAVSLAAFLGVVVLSVQPPSAEAHAGPLALIRFSPEDERPRGGGDGASYPNRPVVTHMRSKIPGLP